MQPTAALENWERDMSYCRLVATAVAMGPARPIDYFKTSPVIWLSMLQGLRSVLALVSETTTTTSAGVDS